MSAQLLDETDPGAHEVLAGANARPQCHRGRGVRQERAQAVAVGAQDVGEDVGIGAVVLVAGKAVAAAQGLDVTAGDDDDRQARAHESVDDRAVGPFDGDSVDPAQPEPPDELPQAGLAVVDLVALDDRAGPVDDADRVAPGRPVDAGIGRGRMHACLRAGPISLGAPLVTGRVRRSLTDPALGMAHSPIAARHVPGDRASRHYRWPSLRRERSAVTRRSPGCIDGMAPIDAPMVDQ